MAVQASWLCVTLNLGLALVDEAAILSLAITALVRWLRDDSIPDMGVMDAVASSWVRVVGV